MSNLEERVEQFQTLSLPGQPQGMHMGTSYLVADLWREVRRLRRWARLWKDRAKDWRTCSHSRDEHRCVLMEENKRLRDALQDADSHISWCLHRHDSRAEHARELNQWIAEARRILATAPAGVEGGK